jgi:hypothetical protein
MYKRMREIVLWQYESLEARQCGASIRWNVTVLYSAFISRKISRAMLKSRLASIVSNKMKEIIAC